MICGYKIGQIVISPYHSSNFHTSIVCSLFQLVLEITCASLDAGPHSTQDRYLLLHAPLTSCSSSESFTPLKFGSTPQWWLGCYPQVC